MTKRKKRGLIAGLIVAGAVATAVLVIIFGFKTKKIVYESRSTFLKVNFLIRSFIRSLEKRTSMFRLYRSMM